MGVRNKPARKACRICKKNRPQWRGNCRPCGAALRAKIDRGELTEQEAEAKGLIDPRKKTGRPLGSKSRESLALIERRLAKSSA